MWFIKSLNLFCGEYLFVGAMGNVLFLPFVLSVYDKSQSMDIAYIRVIRGI